MARRPLIWQLFPAFLVVLLAASGALTFYAAQTARAFHLEQTGSELRERAALLRAQFEHVFASDSPAEIDLLCKELGRAGKMRITAIDVDGRVLGDSDADPSTMENHASRPEVADALRGVSGESLRKSSTLDELMKYQAISLGAPGKPLGVLRIALPVASIQQSLNAMYLRFALAGISLTVLTGLLSFWAMRRIISPLNRMKTGAARFAQGVLDEPLGVPETQEFAGLAQAMNTMAEQLSERIRRAVQQSNELRAVLGSMVEGVLAVDRFGRVLSVNEAAGRLLGVDPGRVQGQSLELAVRNVSLQQFVGRALASEEPIEAEIVLRAEEEQVLQAHGTVLSDDTGSAMGALIVLNDITRLRRLENVRRDFVSNVSHELKTPITTIKGFVETLLDGAMESPEECERFLRIVARHADRLSNIIEDLLTLSRIEQGERSAEGFLMRGNLCAVARAAIVYCGQAAAAKEIPITFEGPDELQADINPPLLEQGVANLIDNAIKYSDPGSPISVRVFREGEEVCVAVTDRGAGIAAEHLPRLFERFYRVDKARSRGVGGTGLGLAIVKHIAQSHDGRVSVESQPGHGSTFAVWLPALPSAKA